MALPLSLRRALAAAGLAGTLLAGCGGDGRSSRGPSAAPSDVGKQATKADLEGHQYLAVSATRRGFDSNVGMHLAFEDGHLRSTGGCNSTGGSYVVKDGRLERRGDGVHTMMSCGGNAGERQDDWLDGLLREGVGARVRDGGNTLVLISAKEAITFGRQGPAGGPTPIAGPKWTAGRVAEDNGGVSIDPAHAPTLQIQDGQATFFTGCNHGTAPAEVVDGGVKFGRLRRTHRTCTGEAATVERFALQMLEGDAEVRFDRRELELTRHGRGLGLAAPPEPGIP